MYCSAAAKFVYLLQAISNTNEKGMAPSTFFQFKAGKKKHEQFDLSKKKGSSTQRNQNRSGPFCVLCCFFLKLYQCTNHYPFPFPKKCQLPPFSSFLAPGAELEDLQEGDVFEGTVTNVGRYGVFVDVGAAPWPKSEKLYHRNGGYQTVRKWWVSG